MADQRAVLWWVDRWRKSTAFMDMTLEEQGAYRNLIDEVYLRPSGVIPEHSIARCSGDPVAWPRIAARVLQWMTKVDGGWTNETGLELKEKVETLVDHQRAAGLKSAAARRERHGSARPPNRRTGSATGSVTGSPNRSRTPDPDPDPDPNPESGQKARKTSPSASRRSAAPPQDAQDVVIWLHCSGKQPAKANAHCAPLRPSDDGSGSQYGVRRAEFDELARAYPGVDVRARLENLRTWLRDTPQKRRTYARFSSWLHSRVADWQDRGRTAAQQPFPHRRGDDLPDAADLIAERDRLRQEDPK